MGGVAQVDSPQVNVGSGVAPIPSGSGSPPVLISFNVDPSGTSFTAVAIEPVTLADPGGVLGYIEPGHHAAIVTAGDGTDTLTGTINPRLVGKVRYALFWDAGAFTGVETGYPSKSGSIDFSSTTTGGGGSHTSTLPFGVGSNCIRRRTRRGI